AGVPQGVGVQIAPPAAQRTIPLNEFLDAPRAEPRSAPTHQQGAGMERAGLGMRKLVATRKVALERSGGRTPQRYDAFLVALASNAHGCLTQVHMLQIEPDEFADAKPRAVEEFQKS